MSNRNASTLLQFETLMWLFKIFFFGGRVCCEGKLNEDEEEGKYPLYPKPGGFEVPSDANFVQFV